MSQTPSGLPAGLVQCNIVRPETQSRNHERRNRTVSAAEYILDRTPTVPDMATILAIDAAWTSEMPSGVALATSDQRGWRCVAVAPSYGTFMALSNGESVDWSRPVFRGSSPDVSGLLSASERLAGEAVDLVAIDMPLATVPFSTRRAADEAISHEFGARWCSAHTPNAIRPGPLGARLTAEFLASGFPLRTACEPQPGERCLLEVYPHPALLSLLRRAQRVPYKVGKRRDYWPLLGNDQRKRALLAEFGCIHDALTRVFGRLPLDIPHVDSVGTFSVLKRFEDALDALVCAWVGVEFLAGNTIPLGDATNAIWCPRDVILSPV